MTQLYCIFNPEGKARLETIKTEEGHSWFVLAELEDHQEALKRVGYTVKPIQIANLEEEVVISKDDIGQKNIKLAQDLVGSLADKSK